jgi:uncharacterized protein (TIGR02246 family)
MQTQGQHKAPENDADPRTIATSFLAELERAWNAGDGDAFAAPFIDTADFVDIRGQLHHGRAAIAQGHDIIFNTIYKGSKVRLEVIDARLLTPTCILFHGKGALEVPSGPLQGAIGSTQTLIAVRDEQSSERPFRLAAFHNTVRP